MDYLSRRERHRLAKYLVNQRIIEQSMDLKRQRENDLRREFQTIIHNNFSRQRNRSYSQSDDYRTNHHQYDTSDSYEEQLRYRSDSLSRFHHHHHRISESRECSLVTLIYHGLDTRRNDDEIMIIQHGRTVFKGCLKHGDQLTFKSKRYRNDRKLKLDFYINDFFEDQIITCCEHSLLNKTTKHLFQFEHVIGTKPCQECQLESETSSTSLSPSSSILKNNRSIIVTNHEERQTLTRQESLINNQKLKTEKKKTTKLSVSQADTEKTLSEGFSANIAELSDDQPLTSIQIEDQQQTEDNSMKFLPALSLNDIESSPPPPKRIYGPPQLSTMLSITEIFDSPFETPLSTHEETFENSLHEKFESLNIEEKKVPHSDSDNDDNNPNETKQSAQFLRSMSSNVENTQTSQIPSMNTNSSRSFAIADEATQLLLTRLGIMRQQQVEHSEVKISNTSRERGNVEYFILVYLNSTPFDDIIIKKFRSLINFLKIFDDIDDCIAFINSILNEKILFITTNSFINLIISRIEDLQQLLSIYILVENQENFLNSTKIKGYYNNIEEIFQQISIDINLITRDLIAYINISSNTTILDPIFIYTYLLSEIILDNEEIDYALKDLINFSRQEYDGNDIELLIIDEFENDYEKNRAIWWFTRPCFLSKMLNKALRIPDADVLFKLRLFIQHLYQQIENESISNITSLTVYLGQTIHLNDLNDLQQHITNNHILVFNQFLTGSTDLLHAINIAKNLPCLSDEYIPVILHLNITSNLKCANTSSLRYMVDDDNDVLLNMRIMGRLIKIEKDQNNENNIASIYLTLIKCENEENIQRLIDMKRKEIKGAAPFVSLIKLMIMMNQQIRAEQLVQIIFDDDLLKSDPNLQGSLAASCHILGAACHARGDFKRAVELFHLSLDTFLRFVPSDAVQLSPTYNNIGSMYFRQEDYIKAAEYHQKALDVQLNSHNPNLNSIASYSNNVGVVQLKQGKYQDAAKSFDRSLKILLQINQSNDSDLASTYDNLGDAHLLQDKYDDALTYYSKALEIQRHIQPCNPQALASFNNSIGNVYNKMHRYGDALVHFKRALEYHQEYLPSTHPSFASLYNNIGSMYYRQEQYADALPYYLKSLEIELMCLPENHPTIAVTHFNIATTYTGLGRFEDAILSTERSVEQLLKTLPPDHPEVIENRSYIDTIKRKQMLKGLFETKTTDY